MAIRPAARRGRGPDSGPRTLPTGLPDPLPRGTFAMREWSSLHGYSVVTGVDLQRVPVEEAELIGSDIGDGMHAPVLDLDVPHVLVASARPGHSHLYLDVPMTWRRYRRLLRALAAAGIVERSWAKAAIKGRRSLVRAPWAGQAGR